MKEEKKAVTMKQTLTEDEMDRMADELIMKALGTENPTPSQIETFMNMLLTSKTAMKSFAKMAEDIAKEVGILVNFDKKDLKN